MEHEQGNGPAQERELVMYQTADGDIRLKVQVEKETVWLTQAQIADLFKKDVRTINEHIQNVFKEQELAENQAIRKFRITAADGNKRLGALLFIFFLQKNAYLFKPSGERKITDATLVSLALLIAMSQPREKEVVIPLVTNLLA